MEFCAQGLSGGCGPRAGSPAEVLGARQGPHPTPGAPPAGEKGGECCKGPGPAGGRAGQAAEAPGGLSAGHVAPPTGTVPAGAGQAGRSPAWPHLDPATPTLTACGHVLPVWESALAQPRAGSHVPPWMQRLGRVPTDQDPDPWPVVLGQRDPEINSGGLPVGSRPLAVFCCPSGFCLRVDGGGHLGSGETPLGGGGLARASAGLARAGRHLACTPGEWGDLERVAVPPSQVPMACPALGCGHSLPPVLGLLWVGAGWELWGLCFPGGGGLGVRGRPQCGQRGLVPEAAQGIQL